MTVARTSWHKACCRGHARGGSPIRSPAHSASCPTRERGRGVTHVAVSTGHTDTARRMGPVDTGSALESDESLMLAYARGDATAFERLYARHKGPTYRYFLRHTSDRGAADELHQDVWLKVVAARGRYVPEARFTTWLYTLATATAMATGRRTPTRPPTWPTRSTWSSMHRPDNGCRRHSLAYPRLSV